jgi:hypothetical protein
MCNTFNQGPGNFNWGDYQTESYTHCEESWHKGKADLGAELCPAVRAPLAV